MKIRITSDVRSIAVAAALPWLVVVMPAVATTPQYQIYDIGVINAGDTASQGFGVSRAGIAVGRSIRTDGSQAFIWTLDYGIIGLPNLAGRSFAVSNSANDSGIVVGTAATTLFGSDRLPVIWQNGAVSQLPLPAGETLGDANSVNASSCCGRLGRRRKPAARRDLQWRQRDDHHANDSERKLLPHRIRHQRFRSNCGSGHRSNECRTQRWDRL